MKRKLQLRNVNLNSTPCVWLFSSRFRRRSYAQNPPSVSSSCIRTHFVLNRKRRCAPQSLHTRATAPTFLICSTARTLRSTLTIAISARLPISRSAWPNWNWRWALRCQHPVQLRRSRRRWRNELPQGFLCNGGCCSRTRPRACLLRVAAACNAAAIDIGNCFATPNFGASYSTSSAADRESRTQVVGGPAFSRTTAENRREIRGGGAPTRAGRDSSHGQC